MNDDDSDFIPSKTTRASGQNESLTYTPKKDPNKTSSIIKVPFSKTEVSSISQISSEDESIHVSGDTDTLSEESVYKATPEAILNYAKNSKGPSSSKISTDESETSEDGNNFLLNKGSFIKGISDKSAEKYKIIITNAVNAYKLENGAYLSKGTAGITIIGSYELHSYQIIIYKSKKEYLSITHISMDFSFNVLENNSASLLDDSKHIWFVVFPSQSDVQKFAKQVIIAKCCCTINPPEKMLLQDLTPLGKVKATARDELTIMYNCSILLYNEIIQFKEKTNLHIEANKSNEYPWYEGLRGVGEKTKRVIILPQKMSHPWASEMPENSMLLIDVEVVSVKIPSAGGKVVNEIVEDRNLGKVPADNKKDLEKGQTDSVKKKKDDYGESADESREDGCKSNVLSIFLSRSHKQDLISRIGRMGQALPIRGPFISIPGDSEDNPCSPFRHLRRARDGKNASGGADAEGSCYDVSHTANVNDSQQQSSEAKKSSPTTVCKYEFSWQQQRAKGEINFSCNQLYPYVTSPLSSGLETGGIENRSQNEDLKMSINKMSEKLDDVLYRLKILNIPNTEKEKPRSNPDIDPMGVLTSVQDVLLDNENLRNKIGQQKVKIEDLNNKVAELNQKHKSNRSGNGEEKWLREKMANLETELKAANQFVIEAKGKISQLEEQLVKYKCEMQCNARWANDETVRTLMEKLKEKEKMEHDMEREIGESFEKIKTLETLNEAQKRETENYIRETENLNYANSRLKRYLSSVLKTGKRDLKLLELSGSILMLETILEGKDKLILQLQEKLQLLEKEVKKSQSEDSSEEIKRVMNALNKTIQMDFASDRHFTGDEVKELVASTIKGVTMDYFRYKSKRRNLIRSDLAVKESASLTELQIFSDAGPSAQAWNTSREKRNIYDEGKSSEVEKRQLGEKVVTGGLDKLVHDHSIGEDNSIGSTTNSNKRTPSSESSGSGSELLNWFSEDDIIATFGSSSSKARSNPQDVNQSELKKSHCQSSKAGFQKPIPMEKQEHIRDITRSRFSRELTYSADSSSSTTVSIDAGHINCADEFFNPHHGSSKSDLSAHGKLSAEFNFIESKGSYASHMNVGQKSIDWQEDSDLQISGHKNYSGEKQHIEDLKRKSSPPLQNKPSETVVGDSENTSQIEIEKESVLEGKIVEKSDFGQYKNDQDLSQDTVNSSSSSTAVNDENDPYKDYYQNWDSWKPPPLPVEDDDDEDNDENGYD